MNRTEIADNDALRRFVRDNDKAVVMFGKSDCVHCSIAESVMDDVRGDFPQIAFAYVEDTHVALAEGVKSFPTTRFYEGGSHIADLIGSLKIGHIRELLEIFAET